MSLPGAQANQPQSIVLEDVPTWALPGGKERPSLVGTFGWLQGRWGFVLPSGAQRMFAVNVPGLDGPGGISIQAAGNILRFL